MKFSKYSVSLLVICVILAINVKQTESEEIGQKILLQSIPLVSKLVTSTVAGPAGPVIVTSLKILQLATKILLDNDKSDGTLSKTDFLKSQSNITDAIQNVDAHLLEVAAKLTDIVESNEFMENMRNDLDSLQRAVADNIKPILNSSVTGLTKELSMRAMLDYYSTFRNTLRSFVTKYIKPKGVVAAKGEVLLFYDFVLRKDRIAADYGEDCHSDSTHSKLFKSYLYILKILTDSYVMAISAHTVQYQKELKAGNESAIETQRISLQLLNQYKNDMKEFMEKTKWALDKASRDIRNCGKFDMKSGHNFQSLLFAHILPKFKDAHKGDDPNSFREPLSCFDRRLYIEFNDYEIGDCTDGDLKKDATLDVYLESASPDWPYSYMINNPTFFRSKQVIGHQRTGLGTFKKSFRTNRYCYPLFCPAFKKNAVTISTESLSAQPGNVITGLRFRVSSNDIYIDIQEGKFIDDLRVDPETLSWTKVQYGSKSVTLNSVIRKIELGGAEVKENDYLTSIQLKLKNKVDGIIGFYVGGASAPDWKTSNLTGSSDNLSKSNELVLSECDNPEEFVNVTNMISKAPVQYKPYHVNFQASDFKKDLGITTIPFIDTREVVTNPPAPIKGFGIYHQTVKGSGGFISLKLITSNLNRFIDYDVIEQSVKTT